MRSTEFPMAMKYKIVLLPTIYAKKVNMSQNMEFIKRKSTSCYWPPMLAKSIHSKELWFKLHDVVYNHNMNEIESEFVNGTPIDFQDNHGQTALW